MITAMKKITLLTGFVLVLMVIVGGCMTQLPAKPVPPTPSPAPATVPVTTETQTPSPPPATVGKWILTTMAAQNGTAPLQPTTEITLVFNADGNLTGYGGCNNYFASYVLTGILEKSGHGINVGPLVSTKKYCNLTAQQETTYLQILQNIVAYSVNINQLTLTDKSENVLMFKVAQATPTPVIQRLVPV
jgi:heat shock protein HslJ